MFSFFSQAQQYVGNIKILNDIYIGIKAGFSEIPVKLVANQLEQEIYNMSESKKSVEVKVQNQTAVDQEINLSVILTNAITIPVAEEYLFRYICLPWLEKTLTDGGIDADSAKIIALLFTSLTFGFLHERGKKISNTLSGWNYGTLYQNHGLETAIIAHVTANTFAEVRKIFKI